LLKTGEENNEKIIKEEIMAYLDLVEFEDMPPSIQEKAKPILEKQVRLERYSNSWK